MLRPSAGWWPALLCIGVAGCATSSLDLAPSRPDRPWTAPTNDHGEIVPGRSAAGGASGTSAADYTLPVNTAISAPPPLAIQPEQAYDLPGLIDLAESNNTVTRSAWNNARQVALAAGIARSAYLPNLSASVVSGYQHDHSHNSALNVDVNGNTSGDGVISALSLQWLLFDFGERGAILRAAQQASIISNIAFTATHQQLIYNVSLAYYAHCAARARVITAHQALDNSRAIQAAAEERLARGIGTVVEAAQARQATAQSELIDVQAEGAESEVYQNLIAFMGISSMTKLKIAELPSRTLPATAPVAVEEIVSHALSRRTDMLAAYAALKASEEAEKAARAEFRPKLFFSATSAYNSGHLNVTAIPSIAQQSGAVNLTGNRFGVTVFAGITVPVYDGGLRMATLEQARAKVDNAGLTLEHTREEAVRQIVVAQISLRTTLSAYSAASALSSASQTTLDAVLTAYRHGVGPITEVLIAQNQALLAKNASTDTYSAALSASATLALALGALGSAPP